MNFGTIPIILTDRRSNLSPSGIAQGIGYVGNPCGVSYESVQHLNCYLKNGVHYNLAIHQLLHFWL